METYLLNKAAAEIKRVADCFCDKEITSWARDWARGYHDYFRTVIVHSETDVAIKTMPEAERMFDLAYATIKIATGTNEEKAGGLEFLRDAVGYAR